jgi:hypothetical protein
MSFKGMLAKAGITISGDYLNLDGAGRYMAVNDTPMIGIPFGNPYFLDYRNGDDDNAGRYRTKAFKTLAAAVSLMTTNNQDVLFIDGDSTVVEAAMVDISLNRTSFIGVNGMPGHYGAGAKISSTVTAGATNIATIKNTGVRNTFANLKVMNSSTVNEGLYAFAEGGEFTKFLNCEFYKDSDLDVTGAAEFLHNGDGAQFYNCTFGSLVNIIADNVIRPNVLLTRELITGKVCRDSYFDNCFFFSKAGGTEHVAVYGAGATAVERMLYMERCKFVNNALSAATPAHAVGFGAAQTEGTVCLDNCSSFDYAVMAQAAVGIYVSGAVPTFATTGVAVAS